MTDEHTPGDGLAGNPLAARWTREWSAHLGNAMEAMTGAACSAEPGGESPWDEADAVWETSLTLVSGARVWVRVPESAWREFGGAILSAAGLDDAGEEELRTTFQEALQQSLSGLADHFRQEAGRDIACENGHWSILPETAEWHAVQLQAGGEPRTLWIAFSRELSAAPRQALAASGPGAEDMPGAEGGHAQPSAAAVALSGSSKTFDLLLEVELPVGVSFGRAQMRLKDMVQLTTGSIVELNRTVSEPVEIVVNNCVIARGEVVVVEGNYGVRIRQIISREERLRTLF